MASGCGEIDSPAKWTAQRPIFNIDASRYTAAMKRVGAAKLSYISTFF
jgi:hypothetical protein